MSSLYPSLEDMKVGQMMQAQLKEGGGAPLPSAPPQSEEPGRVVPSKPSGLAMHRAGMAVPVYPSLTDYMGLDLGKALSNCYPENGSMALALSQTGGLAKTNNFNNMVAPLSGGSVGLQRAHVSNGIRELILCKDKEGKVGVRVAAVNSGIFVCLVAKGSPAEMGGLRFGDQILQVNGSQVAGFTVDQVHKLFKKAPVNGISVIVRDRPFERTVTLHKDSGGRVGFQFKKGEIVSLVKDSSATRNGLLTGHQILEIDGQNVVGLKDKEITGLIEAAPSPLTITIIPLQIYEHIVSNFFPTVEDRLGLKKDKPFSAQMTMLLSGYDKMRHYLHRCRILGSPLCLRSRQSTTSSLSVIYWRAMSTNLIKNLMSHNIPDV